MYLISLYFDEGTNKKIQLYMEQIAQRTGNMAMIDGKVPPHITLSAFDMAEEEKAIAGFTAMEQEFEKGQIFWCSVGMFLPHTIYLSPVLNAYLQKLFAPFTGEAVEIGLARTNPYRDLCKIKLK